MSFEIGGLRVGERQPLFVIAELGLNHGGSLDRALEMVDAAAAAGASAVKLQTFKAEDLVAASCPAPVHVTADSLRDFFREFELDRDAHIEVARRARLHGLAFMATPFSIAAVNMLDEIGVDGYKIASGDLTFDALIARCARTELPLFMSTGMATLAETAHAVALARGSGARGLALMHCVSAIRCRTTARTCAPSRRSAGCSARPSACPITRASIAALPVAVTLGATIYERHLMLPGDDCIDAAVSSTPAQFAEIVTLARQTHAALGHGRRECLPAEAANLTASRRALHATRALQPGHVVTADDIAVLRPSCGLSPSLHEQLIGTVLTRAIEAGAPFLGHDLPNVWSQSGAA